MDVRASPSNGAVAPDLESRCYLGIRASILARQYLPGELLMMDELTRSFGTSRTPVYHALKRLELEGLVEIHPRRGTMVARITLKDVSEVADMRLMVEVHATVAAASEVTAESLAALRLMVTEMDHLLASADGTRDYEAWSPANAAFHRYLVQLAGNERLLKLYDGLNLGVRELRICRNTSLSPLERFQLEHRGMVDALAQRDAPRLQHLVRGHVAASTRRALSALEEVGGVL